MTGKAKKDLMNPKCAHVWRRKKLNLPSDRVKVDWIET